MMLRAFIFFVVVVSTSLASDDEINPVYQSIRSSLSVSSMSVSSNTACPRNPIYLSSNWFLCCGNQLRKLAGASTDTIECCDATPFNTKSQFCCGGIVHEITSLALGCCNSVVYNRAEYVCCNNVLNNATHGIHTDCCGGDAAYKNKYEALKLPLLYFGYTLGSYETNVNDSQVTLYNIKESVCCNSQLINATNLTMPVCCGSSAIDSSTTACCDLTPAKRDRTKRQSCCGAGLFDLSSQMCCDGVAQNRTQGTSQMKCCSSSSYDPSKARCCSGTVDETSSETNDTFKCCGVKSYNSLSSICCAGFIKTYLPGVEIGNQRCCGTEPFDKSRDRCCKIGSRRYRIAKDQRCPNDF